MVNRLHLRILRLYPKRFTIYALIHTHIHTPTAIGCHARCQPAHQEQLRIRRLAQGHFDTPKVGPGNNQTRFGLKIYTHITANIFNPERRYIRYDYRPSVEF